ncbi:uncharacterized protein F5891DRAFT_1193386 [Suillus fuscotomentosus]|uniref:Uncharacterized protein n=1 Tax=Suillus fuscotomentosus TaxID=1912939 RepID=A0AAD4DXW6_9AGAM|nr:uncharacterized protein F5891DRAFT_1193386 [Suillus fuscotomentosus]KAG1896153.1 hypothetical protein F5891DRAFT_1193386 [Suillus fuscotomentosus]
MNDVTLISVMPSYFLWHPLATFGALSPSSSAPSRYLQHPPTTSLTQGLVLNLIPSHSLAVLAGWLAMSHSPTVSRSLSHMLAGCSHPLSLTLCLSPSVSRPLYLTLLSLTRDAQVFTFPTNIDDQIS